MNHDPAFHRILLKYCEKWNKLWFTDIMQKKNDKYLGKNYFSQSRILDNVRQMDTVAVIFQITVTTNVIVLTSNKEFQ